MPDFWDKPSEAQAVLKETKLAKTVIETIEGLDRKLGDADVPCVAWNAADETLAVVTQPLLAELRALNLMSSVFRAADLRPPDPVHGADIKLEL